MATFKDKLSNLIGSQVPDFVLDDHPKFLKFLETYYTFMEAAELSVTSIETTDGIQLETETNQQNKLLLDGTSIGSDRTLIDEGDKLILESSAFGKFTKGETIKGQTSKAISTILSEDLDNNRLFIVAQDKFIQGETILGLSSNASAIIGNYKPNPVNNIQELLNFRDPDKAISNFLSNFRNEFLTTLPETLDVNVNKRNLIKNVKSLYKQKGTRSGHEVFFKLLFNEISETIYPREQMLRISDGKFTTNKILRSIDFSGDLNDLIGREITGQTSQAKAYIESVKKFIIGGHVISESILNPDTLSGTFLPSEEIRGTKTDDDDNIVKSEITGIPTTLTITNSGALYSENLPVTITGGGFDALIQTKSIGSGNITEIIIDNPGLNYSIGDELIFNNANTNGAGAAGFISIVNGGISNEDNSGDRIILEDATGVGDSYEGSVMVQELGTDLGDITDIFLYDLGKSYTSLPVITISTTTGLNGLLKAYSNNIGQVLELSVIEPGAEYETAPSPTLTFFKNLILKNKTGTFLLDETVTSSTSATGKIVSLNNNTGLLVLKNVTGTFTENSTITGNTSNATATVAKVNLATATITVGAVRDTDGVYVNEDGKLSENTMKIQDSLLYQDFSYLIRVARSINDWRGNFKKTMHTAGFYLANEVRIQSQINARIRFPIIGQVSGVSEQPIMSVLNTLFGTIFGRRLGTTTDGTTLRTNAKLGVPVDLNPATIEHFTPNTRDLTLFRPSIDLSIVSRVKGIFVNVSSFPITISQGYAYAGPRYGTINREALRTFVRQAGTNYSIAELSNNLTFGTRTSFDGQDNTLLFCSTQLGRVIKTKLTIPSEIIQVTPDNSFDNLLTFFDSNVHTFDDTTP
jgi:hypothetical protein